MLTEGNTARVLTQELGPIRLRVRHIHSDGFPTEIRLSDTSLPDRVWSSLLAEASLVVISEQALAGFMDDMVLSHTTFSAALAASLSRTLGDRLVERERLEAMVHEATAHDVGILEAVTTDLHAIRDRDPAADGYLTPFLYFKGFQALQWQRISHWYWIRQRKSIAHFLHGAIAATYAVDIHPAVPIGNGVFIDHGTGLVVGETTVIGNNVSILHEVTLGGTGKEKGNRHPKVEDGVLCAPGPR